MIPEDCRTFHEFFPDPVNRFQIHYAFAHEFFLTGAFGLGSSGKSCDPTRWIQSRWSTIFERMLDVAPPSGNTTFRRVTDLSMSLHELDSTSIALIQMPEPENGSEAFFVAVVSDSQKTEHGGWPDDVNARIFTLERTHDPESSLMGVVCQWQQDGVHRYTGIEIEATPHAFLHAVLNCLSD